MNKQQQRNIFAFTLAEEANKKDVAEQPRGRDSWEANKQALAGGCTDTIWWGMPAYSDGNVFC